MPSRSKEKPATPNTLEHMMQSVGDPQIHAIMAEIGALPMETGMPHDEVIRRILARLSELQEDDRYLGLYDQYHRSSLSESELLDALQELMSEAA